MSQKIAVPAALIMLAGILARLPGLSAPPLDFHPTRQYRSAIIARGYYVDRVTHLSGQEAEAVREAASQMGVLEPPIMERLAAWLYRAVGREDLALARLVSVVAWSIGGLALLWLTTQLFSTTAAVFTGLAVMMLLPYAMAASQSFQPDPLMTALTVLGLAIAVRHDRRPGRVWLLLLVLCSVAAMFLKPMAAFFLMPPITAMAVARRGWIRGALFGGVMAAAITIPAAVYYYEIGPLSAQYGLFTRLYRDPGFWRAWSITLDRVVGWPFMITGLVGIALAGPFVRRVLAAAWIGYLLLGLAFAYAVSTHDYYSLPLVPVVAVSVAAFVEAIEHTSLNAVLRRSMVIAGIAAMLVGNGVVVRAAGMLQTKTDLQAQAARYERIGRDVDHSRRVLSLDGTYGMALAYHGLVAASNWPLGIDLALRRTAGQDDTVQVEPRLRASNAEFFVATIQAELDGQPALQALLEQRFPVVDRDGSEDHWRFVVYDLRHSRISTKPARVSLMTLTDGTRWSPASVALWSEEGTHWHIDVPTPDLFEVRPAAGTGPAVLEIVPRRGTSEIDKVVQVSVVGDNSRLGSANFTVRFRAMGTPPTTDPFGSVALPPEPVVLGTAPVTFQGWALDNFDLRRIWAGYVDGSGRIVPIGEAERIWMRPDLPVLFPNAHDLYNDGWVFTLQPPVLAAVARPVILHFYAENGSGRRAEIGHRTITAK